jgi:hypothetical protein
VRVYLDTGVFIDYLGPRGSLNALLRSTDRRGRSPGDIATHAERLFERVSRVHTAATSCLTYYEVEEALYRLLVQSAKGVSHADTLLIPVARSMTTQVQMVVEHFNISVLDLTNWLIPWHQDTALPLRSRFNASGWGPWSEKAGVMYAHAPASALSRVIALRLHLDESNAGNGPLRVIPASHRYGVLSDQGVLEFACAHDPVECVAPRGGVIAMCPLLIHSSSKARSAEPRRVLHIEYADCLDFGDGVHLAVV